MLKVRPGTRSLVAAGLLEHVRYEVIPTPSVEESVIEHVPDDVTVTVTASPTKGLEPTLQLAESLSRRGYHSVPHISARLVRDERHLNEIVARLKDANVDEVFVPAGDADPPAGTFDGALPVLSLLAAKGRPFSRAGITGHPQSHPRIHDDVTIQAMWDKRRFADYIVSNLCLDPVVLRDWIRRVRRRGVTLPLFIGLAGPIDRTKLLSVATKIGIGESARFATRHLPWLAQFGSPGCFEPNNFLDRVGSKAVGPNSNVEGLHVFTFNQLAGDRSLAPVRT